MTSNLVAVNGLYKLTFALKFVLMLAVQSNIRPSKLFCMLEETVTTRRLTKNLYQNFIGIFEKCPWSDLVHKYFSWVFLQLQAVLYDLSEVGIAPTEQDYSLINLSQARQNLKDSQILLTWSTQYTVMPNFKKSKDSAAGHENQNRKLRKKQNQWKTEFTTWKSVRNPSR